MNVVKGMQHKKSDEGTVKYYSCDLIFVRPPLGIYSQDFISMICHILFNNPLLRKFKRGLYFRDSMLSKITLKLKSSLIRSVFQKMVSSK